VKLLALGVDHHSSPTAIREALAFDGPRRDAGLDAFAAAFPSCEFVVLSTCNRVEVYTAADDPDAAPDVAALADTLGRFHDLPVETLAGHLVAHHDEAVVGHLFRVASSLEIDGSLIQARTTLRGDSEAEAALDAAFHQLGDEALASVLRGFATAAAHNAIDLRAVWSGPTFEGDGDHTTAALAQERIDTIYSEQLSAALQKMKAIPEGAGNMLDNTLVVFFNECAVGNTHSIENMPTLMLGGKMLGMQTGQHLQLGGVYMNDVWAAVCGAFGIEAKFGDPAFAKTPVSGLFA
jgi:hypothetical protein